MRRPIALFLATVLSACSDNGGTGIDDRTGVVRGVAYMDRDADGSRGSTEPSAVGVLAALVQESTGDTVATRTTASDGSFVMPEIPIGRYRLVAGRGTLGDSVTVLGVPDNVFNLAQSDTVTREIRIGYPTVSAAQVRTLPSGRRVIVEGVALNGWATFADSTIHLRDATGAIRVVRAQQSSAQAGDSIQVLGTTGVRDGRTVVADATIRILSAAVGLPPIDSLSTASVASAQAGALADAHARIGGAVIQDTTRVGLDFILGVDDGSGRVEVVLDANVPFNPGTYVPGATFAGRGVLVPAAMGTAWRLKPRDRDEATVSFPTVTIAAARGLEEGRRIIVQGVALNSWAAFGDSTVHLMDATGFIRGVRVLSNVAAGDSIRMLGTVTTRAGQPVLTAVTPTLLRAGVGISLPDSVSTAQAAGARGGTLDAAHVRLRGTIIAAQPLPGGDRVLGVDDGSGRVDVVLDANVPFNAGPYEPGALLQATGVLVATGSGTWQLKPRAASDVVATYPTVTVSEARALPAGKTVFVHGLALNGWITFGDSTVHVADAGAAIRVLRLPPTTLFAGDSVRILGTAATRNGQPVLLAGSAAVLQAGVGLSQPDSITTGTAAAAGSARDASQAAVSGTITALSTDATGNYVITLDDGSGPLSVVLDTDVGFPTGGYAIGSHVRARGVLVPTAAGNVWELKPRSLSEIQSN